ncbi:PD-(D/E)XK nuclease family transposase, partial [Holdemanella biformis]|uniref:PD-(D/E)XK nuclease family transposase n=1 Tax=Holdemanella biformis TaxID=1735 RepID=UPI0022E65177
MFLERKVNKVVVKNSELVKDYSKMKSPRLDLLVEFDDRTMVDLEMQLRQTKDNFPIRFSYYEYIKLDRDKSTFKSHRD